MSSRSPSTAARWATGLALVALLLAGCGSAAKKPASASGGGGATGAKAVTVKIASFKFAPETITVPPGARVTWTNRDQAPHTATSNDDGQTFDTNTLRLGQSKTVTLTKPGTYSYHCQFHAFMTAKVVVK